MKIKTELGISLFFAMNAGIIILAICRNILHHQWIMIPTNSLLLIVSIYFACYWAGTIINRVSDRTSTILAATNCLIDSTHTMLDWTKELVNKLTGKENIELDIVCDEEKYMPRYANSTDACLDLKIKICTEDKENEVKTDCYFLRPNETQVFSTGIKVSVPEDYAMLIYPRSSTGFKLKCMLSNTTGIIDAGYRDEVKLAITNFGSKQYA